MVCVAHPFPHSVFLLSRSGSRVNDIHFDVCIRRRPQNDALPLSSFSVRDPRVNNNFDRENDKADETMFRPTTTTQPDVQIQRFAVIADDFIFSMILERTAFNSDGKC